MRKIPKGLLLRSDESNFRTLSKDQEMYGTICMLTVLPMVLSGFLFITLPFGIVMSLPAATVESMMTTLIKFEMGLGVTALFFGTIFFASNRRHQIIGEQLWQHKRYE